MSRGLGQLQRDIKQALDDAASLGMSTLRRADLLAIFAAGEGDLSATRKRAIGRSVKSLVDRGDVVIIDGVGRPGNPYQYVTVEAFAASTGQTIRDTAHAKAVVAELAAGTEAALAKLRARGP
jgi:hypothetical protein